MLYVGYWRIPGRKDAVHGYIEADTEEIAYEALRSRLAYYCRITAIYKACTQPTKIVYVLILHLPALNMIPAIKKYSVERS